MTDSEAALPLLSRYAIMVDVRYIYASPGELLFSAASRREYRVDTDRLIPSLIKQADDQVTGQLLRVYWSDAAQTTAHGTLPARADTGTTVPGIPVGQMAAPSPAQLFGDKTPFRSHAKQNSGVHLNATHLAAARLGPSRERVEEAGEHVAQKWILTRGEDNIRDLLPGPILPPVIDKELLVDAEKELGLSLRSYQEARARLRDAFWARVHRQFGVGVGRSKG